jgi:hypothetical protein
LLSNVDSSIASKTIVDCPKQGCDVMHGLRCLKKANAEADAFGMTGPFVPFLPKCHAMHRAGSKQARSNTQHDDSAIDYLWLHGSRARPQADDDLHCPED